MIYLCSPYSHPDEQVRIQRFDAVRYYAVKCFRRGEHIFSPILHSHTLVELGMAGDAGTWESWNREALTICSELRILCIDGWIDSQGVQAERDHAHELKHRVTLVVDVTANAIANGEFHRNGELQIERVKRLLDNENAKP